MDSNHQDLVAQFCGVTGADASSAHTALASADWNLQEAVALYFAAQEEGEDEESEDDPAQQQRQSASDPQPSLSQPSAAQSAPRRPPQNQSRMRTLRDLQGSTNDDDDDDEKDQDFFAGGEKSGLAVQNPGSAGGPADHFRNIMSQARQHRDRPPPSQAEEEGPAQSSHFAGRAQTLGGDDEPSRVIGDPPEAAGGGRARTERITRTMHLWADGISIDDGPLFRFDDPNNASMMAQINRGQAPLSLLDARTDQEVDLTLEPHKDENYVPPKKKYKPFGGQGQRLGSPTPGPTSTASGSTTAAAPPTSAAPAANPTSAAPAAQIDESAPTLTLQIRLGDGTRLTSRFNTTQTIGDVYDFVDRASAQGAQRAYALMTTFPSKELEDRSQVLGDEFKRGGSVVQKWK